MGLTNLIKDVGKFSKNRIRNLALASGLALTLYGPQAKAGPILNPTDWDVILEDMLSLDPAIADYRIGVVSGALDGYDIQNDILLPPLPPGLAHFTSSLVDGNRLIDDIKAPLNGLFNPKQWNFEKIISDPTFTGYSVGTQDMLSWNISSVPNDIELILTDYGSDSSRTSSIANVDLRSFTDYKFNINVSFGPYRYFTLTTTQIPEPSTAVLLGSGLLGLLYLGRRVDHHYKIQNGKSIEYNKK